MITMNLGSLTKVRIWINEPPDIDPQYSNFLSKKKTFLIKNNKIININSLTIEFLKVSGPRITYGLLGFLFSPSYCDGLEILEIKVPFSNLKTNKSSRLFGSLNEIRIGLTEDFAKHVLRVSIACLEEDTFPSGELVFKYSGYDDVGSNYFIFETLTKCLLKLFSIGNPCIGKEEISTIMRDNLNNSE